MPGPIEYTPWRRVTEQAIMWIILAGTVGMAALVDARLGRLGPPQRIGNFSLRLPGGWIETEDHGQDQISLQERGESGLERSITVSLRSRGFSLNNLFGSDSRRTVINETVTLADGTTANVRVLRRSIRTQYGSASELETLATVPSPQGRTLYITLEQISFDERSDIDAGMRLMRRILETMQIE